MAVLTRAEERLVRRLQESRRRRDERLFLAEGIRVVEELLDAGIVLRLALVSSALGDTERGEALAHRLADGPTTREVTATELNALAATRSPQGVLAVAEIPATDLATLELDVGATIVVLDGVQDPGNIGAIARSAAAFGCELLACLPGTVDPWNPKSVRAAAGALFRIPVLEPTPHELWQWLAGHRVSILGADAGGEAVGVGVAPPRVALIVGNEGAGLSAGARERCHRLVAVPMRRGTESLNVAVATGILLYELTRERV